MSNGGKKPDPVDVVVVGTGAGGGTCAKVLAEAGLKVVGLDRGPWFDAPKHFSGDEIKFINRNYIWPDNMLEPRTFRKDADSDAQEMPFSPMPFVVGGGTTHFAGWFPRPSVSDFRMRSLHGDIDGASLADWPISYDDLEPYLTKVEWAYGCCGLAGADRNEAPRSKGFPTPPAPPTQFGKVFYDACAKLGINAYPIPHASVTTPYNGRDCSNYTGFWNQFGDPSTMRSSTATIFVPEALATGNYELRADCYVQEITVHPDGRAKGVVYEDLEGNKIEQEAKTVILAATAIESARLMLLSKSNVHPDGIGNHSGQLGKHATFHEYLFAIGLFDRAVSKPMHGYTGFYISGGSMDFYETDESRGHIGGCLISASETGPPVNWVFPGRPAWGMAAKHADRDFFDHSFKIGIILHDLPQETNCVDLDPDVKDAWGLPVARITHKPHQNDIDMADWQIDKNVEILEAAGAATTVPTHLERSTGNTCHQHGTTRMGDDPEKSVLDKWCKVHSCQNLFVLDGGPFPTSMGVNPTLTIMANAWRCCDYIAGVVAKGGG
jgi:choline dehydrogenase-like flavoprotein